MRSRKRAKTRRKEDKNDDLTPLGFGRNQKWRREKKEWELGFLGVPLPNRKIERKLRERVMFVCVFYFVFIFAGNLGNKERNPNF